MMNTEITFLVQSTGDFESPKGKNEYIQAAESERIGFIDGDVTSEEELRQILVENPELLEYDAIVFGADMPEGECDHFLLLEHSECVVYALVFRKTLLVNTGSYNRFLTSNVNYEFLLRLAEQGKVYSIPCGADKTVEFAPTTMAYIVRRYMEQLKGQNKLDETFWRIVHLAEQAGKKAEFSDAMNSFLTVARKYEQIVMDTAPILIMVSSDLEWYGVVDGFANSLADELVQMGQSVIITNGRYGDYYNIPQEKLLNQICKAVVGFQSPALQSATFRNVKGARYQFWLDNPIFSLEFFEKMPKETYVLCQDANYATFLREHYSLEKAMQFPPAGMKSRDCNSEKIYDLVFIGSYIPVAHSTADDDFVSEFIRYMQMHVDATVEQGVRAVWQKQGILFDEETLLDTIKRLGDVCHNLLHSYRHRVIESILDTGIAIHVFGESWYNYLGIGRENLVIHPKLMAEEALQVWSQAKIGLNIMNGHKAGMTERVANIMLCKTCCLSDETDYLKEHFCDGEDIVLFRADRLEDLTEKIKYLLQHDNERERIAQAGYKKALQEHTWEKRAKELRALIDEGISYNGTI